MGPLQAKLEAGAATDASVGQMLNLKVFVEGLRIVTPETTQITPL
jgi:hypothetical protein